MIMTTHSFQIPVNVPNFHIAPVISFPASKSPVLPGFALCLPMIISNITSGYFLNAEYFNCCFCFRSPALWCPIQLLLKSLWSLSSTFLCRLLLSHQLYSIKQLIALSTFILREDAKPNSFHKFLLMCIITHLPWLLSSSNKCILYNRVHHDQWRENKSDFQTPGYLNLTVHFMLCYLDIFTSVVQTVLCPLPIYTGMFSAFLTDFLLNCLYLSSR